MAFWPGTEGHAASQRMSTFLLTAIDTSTDANIKNEWEPLEQLQNVFQVLL